MSSSTFKSARFLHLLKHYHTSAPAQPEFAQCDIWIFFFFFKEFLGDANLHSLIPKCFSFTELKENTGFVIGATSGLDALDKQRCQTSKQKAASLGWCWEWRSGVGTQLLYSPLKECHLRADCRKRKSPQKQQAFTQASEIPLNYFHHEWSNFMIIGLKKIKISGFTSISEHCKDIP